MKLSTLAKWHPFLCLGVFTVLVMIVGRWVPLQYDDRGLGTAWFAFVYALTFVFRMSSQVTYGLVGQHAAIHTTVALILGFCVYVIADVLLNRYAKARAP